MAIIINKKTSCLFPHELESGGPVVVWRKTRYRGAGGDSRSSRLRSGFSLPPSPTGKDSPTSKDGGCAALSLLCDEFLNFRCFYLSSLTAEREKNKPTPPGARLVREML